MARLAGKLAFVSGFTGFVFVIVAFLLEWQKASGGISMGLWQFCAPSCHASELPCIFAFFAALHCASHHLVCATCVQLPRMA